MINQNKKNIILPILVTMLLVSGCAKETPHKAWHPFKGDLFQRTSENEVPEEEKPEQHLQLKVTDKGYDIYAPTKGVSFDYRYGPSVMLHDDGSMDSWFASPADGVQELDWVTYIHSDDGGETWSDEKVVLSPTPGSKDELSICDPDAFYYDGYYYLGYTSTMDIKKQGLCNSAFIARSPDPDGPFEKWNGSGWGSSPEPLIYYDGVWTGWGVGEPSFVLLDDTLYIYVTRDAYTPGYERLRTTEVYKADINEEDWPARLSFAGYAVDRTDTDPEKAGPDDYIYSDCDSWDVAYVEEAEKFVAVCTNRRFKSDSCILCYESDDGIYFERVSELNSNVLCASHNCAIMSDESGHIKADDPTMIAYSYAGTDNSEWGTWATRFAPLQIDISDTFDRSEDDAENLKAPIEYKAGRARSGPIFVTAEDMRNYIPVSSSSFHITYWWIDGSRNHHGISPSDIDLDGYDKNIVSAENGKITPLSPGSTTVDIGYKGLTRKLRLYVLPADVASGGRSRSDITDIFSPIDSYTVSLSLPYATQIRPMLRFRDYSFAELDLEGVVSYGITFASDDPSVCEAGADGTLMPLSSGDTAITVSCGDDLSYRVEIHVVE